VAEGLLLIEIQEMNKLLLVFISFSFVSIGHCQTVDFSFDTEDGKFCNPSTVTFRQNSTGNPTNFIWAFGNNTFSDKPIATATYTAAGTYTVKLVAIYETGTLGITKTIVIKPVVPANITSNKYLLCQPGSVNLTSTGTSPGTNYEWQFGDGTPMATSASNTVSHSFANFGTSTVNLKTITADGCTDTDSAVITVKAFPVTATSSQIRGCIPATIDFSGSATVPPNTTITNYTWDYGDGSPQFSSAQNTASHVYNTLGVFKPTLTVSSSDGCSSTYQFFNTFSFGNAPTDLVAYPLTGPVCGSDSAVFIAKSTGANRYFWTFGDGTDASTTDTIIRHKFNSVGDKRVRVKPNYNECAAASVAFTFKVIGVVAKFDYVNTCSEKYKYSFKDTSSGKPTSSIWLFGDGNQQADIIAPVNSFPVTGQFRTTLKLQDTVSGCSDSISKMIYTGLPRLFSADSSVCRNSPLSFAVLSNYGDTSARYTWHLFDSISAPLSNDTITVPPRGFGNFDNFVVIGRGPQNCPDTLRYAASFDVRGPRTGFISPPIICENSSLLVTNNSTPYVPADTIQSWSWNFGASTETDPLFQPAAFRYPAPGDYTVTLAATDKNGCVDTLRKMVTVNPAPYLHIQRSPDTSCTAHPVTLMAIHNNEGVTWSPATNISCTGCDTTIVNPAVTTRYFATVGNSFNCKSTDSIEVKIHLPFTTTIQPGEISLCPNEAIEADINPKGNKILWSPATGLSDPTSYNPVVTTTQSTRYTVTLTDSSGCVASSSATLDVQVRPLPSVNAGADKFYSTGTSFRLEPVYSNDVVKYLWSPPGLLSCTDCATPSGIANGRHQFVVKVTSANGCSASDSLVVAVDCKSAMIYMAKAFTPNNDNLNDRFYPRTTGITSINKFIIYNRFGQVVYQASNFPPNDQSFGWNGKYKGVNQPMNTYVYSLESVCDVGEKIYRNGSFVLMR
jgi:gliding motility-associated-like protein